MPNLDASNFNFKFEVYHSKIIREFIKIFKFPAFLALYHSNKLKTLEKINFKFASVQRKIPGWGSF